MLFLGSSFIAKEARWPLKRWPLHFLEKFPDLKYGVTSTLLGFFPDVAGIGAHLCPEQIGAPHNRNCAWFVGAVARTLRGMASLVTATI